MARLTILKKICNDSKKMGNTPIKSAPNLKVGKSGVRHAYNPDRHEVTVTAWRFGRDAEGHPLCGAQAQYLGSGCLVSSI